MSQPIRGQGDHLVFPKGPKNTNLVEGVNILLPVKCRWIPFSGFRGEVETVKVKDDRRWTDGRRDDGQRMITIVHLSLRLRCTLKVFFMHMLPLHINQNGSAYAELGRKPSITRTNKESSAILSDRSLRTEFPIEKKNCNKTGGLAINLYRKLNTYAKDLIFQECVVD